MMIKDRQSALFVGRCTLLVEDGSLVVLESDGLKTQIPIACFANLMLEPGATITHEAVKLVASLGCQISWVGDGGVRHYAATLTKDGRADNLIKQAKLYSNEKDRAKVARNMFCIRFDKNIPKNQTIEQLRGLEGIKCKQIYKNLAKLAGVQWQGRRVGGINDINICISTGNLCLYGLCETAIINAGYSPSLGFLHNGLTRSFVYDIADLFKFETVVPISFSVASKALNNPERQTRVACRNYFREYGLLKKIVPMIEKVLDVSNSG